MKRRLGLHGDVVAVTAPPLSTRSTSADGTHTGRSAFMEIRAPDMHTRERQRSINPIVWLRPQGGSLNSLKSTQRLPTSTSIRVTGWISHSVAR